MRHVGRRVLTLDRVDSTNNVALEHVIDLDNDGLAVLADEQTAGRGRMGRTWNSPPGSGVWLSVLLFPPPELLRPAVLTAWAAVSVCEAIREATGLQARIKWPNDVLVRGKKVCGILIEQRSAGNGRVATICGIGLNVSQPAEFFIQAELPHAASLAVFTKTVPPRDTMAQCLLRQLDEQYDSLWQGGLATLEACWKWRLGLLGRQVVVECTAGSHCGRLRDLTWDAVELEHADGRLLRLRPETVQHLVPARL